MSTERKPYEASKRYFSLAYPDSWKTLRQVVLGNRYDQVIDLVHELDIPPGGHVDTLNGRWQIWQDRRFKIINPDIAPQQVRIGVGLYRGDDESQHLLFMLSKNNTRFTRGVRRVTERLVERRGGYPHQGPDRLVSITARVATSVVLFGGIENALIGQPSLAGAIFGAVVGRRWEIFAQQADIKQTMRKIPNAKNYWADDQAIEQLLILTDHINSAVTFNELLDWLISNRRWQGYSPNEVWKIYTDKENATLQYLANDRLRERRAMRLDKPVDEVAIDKMGKFVVDRLYVPPEKSRLYFSSL